MGHFLSAFHPVEFDPAAIPLHAVKVALTEALTSNRIEGFRYELLNRYDAYLGDITTVKSARIIGSIFNAIKTGGTLELMEDGSIDYLNDRVRLVYRLKVGSTWAEWPLGVFLLASPGRITDGKSVQRSIEMYDKLLILDQDKVEQSYTIAEGAVVTAAIKTAIEGAGESKINISPSAETLQSARTWPPGTSRLSIVNDLLNSINYFSLYADGNGTYRGEPYVPPGQRSPVWTFADNSEGLYLPDVAQDADNFSVANKVILAVSNPDDDPLTATATNEDAESPFSYQSRGRWITDYRQEEEATSQDVLDAKAARILSEAMQVSETITYDHAWLPVGLNDAVKFTNSKLGLSAKYSIIKQDYKLEAGGLIRSEIRRVVT